VSARKLPTSLIPDAFAPFATEHSCGNSRGKTAYIAENPKCQRHFVLQPRVARAEASNLGTTPQNGSPTPTGLKALPTGAPAARSFMDASPLGLSEIFSSHNPGLSPTLGWRMECRWHSIPGAHKHLQHSRAALVIQSGAHGVTRPTLPSTDRWLSDTF
jgi:hypothetical protein